MGQPVPFCLSTVNQYSSVHHFPESPPQTQTGTDLVPEFDLSIPTAGDNLGGFVRMPQCAYAHLVMSFDPVVELGGLPVPNIQLSICVT